MKRKVIAVIATAILAGLASTSFANEAQPELQPTPLEFGWFKKPADAMSYLSEKSGTAHNAYQFVNDASPL